MSTTTPLLSLVKPDGTDAALISDINTNMDVLDNAVTLAGVQTLTNKTLTSPTMTTVTVSSGGIAVTGNSTIVGTLSGLTGLDVDGNLTFNSLTLNSDLVMGAAASQIVPGATSFAVRNNADTLDNLLVSDAGAATIRAGLTVTAGGLTVTAGGATVTAGDVTISAGLLGVGGAPNAEARVTATGTITTANPHGYRANPTLVTNANGVLSAGLYSAAAFTINAAVTQTRAAQVYLESVTATVNGTLSAHNALFLGTPVGGTSVNVIDSASGATLTTAGVWTDAPSHEIAPDGTRWKDGLAPVTPAELASLFEWFATGYRPLRYRYVAPADKGPHDQPYAYPHFGYRLEDIRRDVREIICADAGGSISGKDERGLLLAMVAHAAQRIAALEARLT